MKLAICTYSFNSSLLQAVNRYLQRAEKELQESPQLHSDTQWFMKVAWNTALQANSYLAEMIKAFQMCYQVNCPF